MRNLFVVALLVIGLTTFAQEKGKKGERKNMSPEERTEIRVEKMTKELDLNETQQKQVKELLASQKEDREEIIEKRKEIKETAEKATKEQREEMKAIMEEKKEAIKSKMKTILTDDQFKKWESNLEDKKEKTTERKKRKGKKSK